MAMPGPLSIITVPFDELHDTTTENIDLGAVRATKKFKVAWNDRIQFYKDVIGHATVTGVSSGGHGLFTGGTITRTIPLQYPDIPSLYATSISMEAVGESGPGSWQIKYDWAYITVGFSTLPWNFQSADDPQGFTPAIYRTESVDLSGEFLNMPASAFKFAGPTNAIITQPIGITVPTSTLSVTIYQAPYIPFDYLYALVGSCNDDYFYGAPPGTMLFLGMQSQAETNVVGFRTQQLTMKFQYKYIGWNMFALPDGSGFDTIVYKVTPPSPTAPITDNTMPYQLGTFTPLLFL